MKDLIAPYEQRFAEWNGTLQPLIKRQNKLTDIARGFPLRFQKSTTYKTERIWRQFTDVVKAQIPVIESLKNLKNEISVMLSTNKQGLNLSQINRVKWIRYNIAIAVDAFNASQARICAIESERIRGRGR